MMNQQIYASIITIGDELLIGQTIDTNSAWMAQELNKIGVWVKRRVAVGDKREDIWQALDEESEHAQIILLTGGLGPTADDITKPLLCDYFGGKMIMDENVLQHVTAIFRKLNRPMIDRNIKQAEVPDVCTVLMNKRGTAPGMLFRKGNCIYVSMPGVPHEMKGLMQDKVLPLLQKDFHLPFILHRTLLTAGVGESFLADKINEWEIALPAHIKLAYLPNYGMVRLRLTSTGNDEKKLSQELDEQFTELQQQVAEHMVINEDITLEEALGKLLLSKNQTMATAESCSGGYIAHLLTSIPGSSVYFKGTVVAYAYDVKEDVLGVNHETLEVKGAVSEETVREMLTGLLNTTTADYGIATSGVMGPGGGTTDKPVGTVWVAVGTREKAIAKKLYFRFDRLKNIELTAAHAMLLLYRFIKGDNLN
ncbi:CinA family nicotinamide mononucleotide deamidase-related protein [Lacibacter luteus]|uniref:CinA-like protein n=1 Tax=Lacibacter luteus TaxID=2508719 RepID=A0A4Q1CEE9_9BACT|nr:CinA family nicotinamide mononucleotide deamidase-related protein [Lacibacter luteus]RXK58130.1 CinA family nicotinamide mononucleotide deamidase-related protein [Lacibacter luteus]